MNEFEMSAEVNELFDALSAFQGEVEVVQKTKDNPFFKSKYADLSDCWDAIREPLSKNHLSVSQFPVLGGLITVLGHKSGQYMRAFHPMRPAKENDPQSTLSCLTYNRRGSLQAVLGLSADEDDDGNKAAGEKTRKTLTEEESNTIHALVENFGFSHSNVLRHYKVESYDELPSRMFKIVKDEITAKGKAKNASK